MKKNLFLLLIIILFSQPILSQVNENGFALEFTAGLDIGMWIFNKGSIDGNPQNSLGWERTLPSSFMPLEFDILYKWQRWKIGAGINYTVLFRRDMKGVLHSPSNYDIFPIAKNSVKIFKYIILLEADLVQAQKYTLNPFIKAGKFNIDTQHPDKNNFGCKIYWEYGLNNLFKYKAIYFLVALKYSVANIESQSGIRKNAEHNIYSIGFSFGFRYWL